MLHPYIKLSKQKSGLSRGYIIVCDSPYHLKFLHRFSNVAMLVFVDASCFEVRGEGLVFFWGKNIAEELKIIIIIIFVVVIVLLLSEDLI